MGELATMVFLGGMGVFLLCTDGSGSGGLYDTASVLYVEYYHSH